MIGDDVVGEAIINAAPNEHALPNDLAIRCFRYIGDGDYIAARMALRARLPVQFLWSGLQAIEKYLKCILVLNRVSAKGLSHNIKLALEKVRNCLKVDVGLSVEELEVFNHIAESGTDRYLISSVYLFEHELTPFDSLVWKLRQYCVPLNVIHYNDEPSQKIFRAKLAAVSLAIQGVPQDG